MSERVEVHNPDPSKSGSTIDRDKYDVVRKAILDAIEAHGEIRFKDLRGEVEERLPENFDGSPGWYTTTVKLDLEARGLLERIPGASPQRLRIR